MCNKAHHCIVMVYVYFRGGLNDSETKILSERRQSVLFLCEHPLIVNGGGMISQPYKWRLLSVLFECHDFNAAYWTNRQHQLIGAYHCQWQF